MEVWRGKKFILTAILITVVLLGSILGMSCSSAGDGGEELPSTTQDVNPPEDMPPEDMPPEGMPSGPGLSEDLLARVAEILGIDEQEMEDAFAQAQSEMQTAPTEARLQNLVDEGEII